MYNTDNISIIKHLNYLLLTVLQNQKAQAVKIEHCKTRMGDKEIFVVENSFGIKCPKKNSELTFVSNQEILKISSCIKKLSEPKLKEIEILDVKNLCGEKCSNRYCELHYVLDLQNYVPRCVQSTFQQKQFSLCEVDKAIKDSKNNSDSKYSVIITVVVFVVILVVGTVTFFYRRQKSRKKSNTVS